MSADATAPDKELWLRPVEQLVLPALEGRIRIQGFTSAEEGTGVTSLCMTAAEVLARSGTRVLLIDLSSQAPPSGASRPWSPGRGEAAAAITPTTAGYDLLRATTTPASRFQFNNPQSLRTMLTEELSGYAVVVVDLPPLIDNRPQSFNPIACALVCDDVVLVCAQNLTTRTSAASATAAARSAGVKLTGAVWNRRGQSTPGEEMARSARKWLSFIPPLARSLDRRLRRTPLLND
jgi:Mrp family chromosome partitioning ATPase